MEAATNRSERAFSVSKVSYARNLGRFAKCVLYVLMRAIYSYISCTYMYEQSQNKFSNESLSN